MATKDFRLSKEAVESLVKYVLSACRAHKSNQDFKNKMEQIDISYARYNYTKTTGGVDPRAAETPCGVGDTELSVPIVVSQVDSFVGYLADVFLSGYPIFPVVSTPKYQEQADQLQAIIDTHSVLGGYPRQLLMALRDGIKYNFFGVELDWCPIKQYSVLTSYKEALDNPRTEPTDMYYNKLLRLDPYNLVFDKSVLPGDVSHSGEYAGYIEIISRVELKKRLAYFAKTEYGYNTAQAIYLDASQTAPLGVLSDYYTDRPQISNLIAAKSSKHYEMIDWDAWVNSERQGKSYAGRYEFITMYAKIVPNEHRIANVPSPGTPQIWKLCVVNGTKLVFAKRIFSAYDVLPILIGQPIEDGFDIQTQSIGELQIPYQDAASTLFSIRFNAARRAVSDRAIYDPQVIDPINVNSPTAAPKIPIRQNSLLGVRTLDQVYRSIPFDPRGTEQTIQDIGTMLEFADQLSGLNRPMRGAFQKGNKSVKEWMDTMSGADNRMRLPALTLEYQVFVPMKEQIKLNIFQYGSPGTYMNLKSGEPMQVSEEQLNEIRKMVMQFKVADGYTPKSKLAGTEFLAQGIQTLSQSQILQQTLGPALPKMFTHLMSLGGVHGMEEYLPETQDVKPGLPEGTE